MAIERLDYKSRNDVVLPKHKTVLEQIDEHYYLLKEFYPVRKESSELRWCDSERSSRFDGNETHNGVLKYAPEGVQKRFEMLMKYEGFVEVIKS